MRYGSVCSGIEAATVAWHPLGWTPVFFAEIAAFPSRVLADRWPGVPNVGDFTKRFDHGPIDLLVGGTPCQSFSVAGLRGGLDDERGNLALEFLRLADRSRARWVLWENVPGVLSVDEGRAFGSILGGLAELGYGFAYRVLDAQFFGVPQRRRRVFVVGHLGGWAPAAAVLFERASLRWDSPPSRTAGTEVAGSLEASTGGINDNDARAGRVVHALTGFDLAQVTSKENRSNPKPGGPALAFHHQQDPISAEVSMPLEANSDGMGLMTPRGRVRRLTPRECERLQGFPDDYTLIDGDKDGPRYRALGNSMAVPCMRWLADRIDRVEQVLRGHR